MAAAQGGDRRALETLLRGQYDRVFAVCRRLAGNDADAADATQEALISVVKGLGRFDGTSRFSTWVYRIAVNRTLDELRRRKRRGFVADIDSVVVSLPSSEGAVVDRVDVDTALLQLPVDFRAAVVLRDLCGLDYAEIANVLSIPPGTVRSRIARARAALAGNPALAPDRPTSQP